MKTKKTSISIIINVHDENLLLHKTLRSIGENITLATKDNIDVEVIVVADKVDERTKEYLETRAKDAISTDFIIEYVQYGDLGLSRNHGIKVAKGEYIGNFDGDDIWSDNWIRDAVLFLKLNPGIIAHPAAVLNFEDKNGVWHIKDSTSREFNPRSLIEDNWWPSCMIAHASTFDKVKYQKTMRERNFSFEDWLFNCETLANGYEHRAVPRTTIFYRRKKVSMLVKQITGIPTPNSMFTLSGQNEYLKSRKILDDTSGGGTRDSHLEVSIPNRDKTLVRKIAIATVKKSGKIAVKVGKKYVKPRIDSHHRIKNYLRTIKNATHTLITDPNEGLSESRKNIPGWLRNQWYLANKFEPKLFPTHNRVSTAYSRKMMTMGLEQEVYWDIAAKLGENVDYLLIMPYIRRAGAYLVGMHYVKAYKELYPDKNVFILTTENKYDSVESMVPDGVTHIKVPDRFYELSQQLKDRVLAKLITYLQPKYVQILHSQEGFRALKNYPGQTSFKSKIILTTFNYDYTAEGQKMNAFLAYADEILPYVTKVFTDNEWVAEDTVRLFGVDKKLVSAHNMPISVTNTKRDGVNLRSTDGKMRILWAARMAKQKRPDILLKIAKSAHKKKLPFEFIVYGEIYDNIITNKMLRELAELPNVQYRGAFHDGIQKLPTGEFEVYLSTSEAEGTPNAILEAQESRMLVVAPDLGGIPEAVQDKISGMLVNRFDSIDEYIDKLQYVYDNSEEVESMIKAARKSIEKERSWGSFVEQFKLDLKD